MGASDDRNQGHHMTHAKTVWTLLAALLAAASLSCTDIEPCDEHGDEQSCTCSGGDPGTQVCLPEKVWDDCDCSAQPEDDDMGQGGSGGAAAGASGGSSGAAAGAGAGGSAGATAGAGAGGSAAAGTGGSDAEPMLDGGLDGGELAGAGGSAGAGGAGGAGGGGGQAADPYRTCTADTDCDSDATCLTLSIGFPLPTDEVHVCAPACTAPANCAVPAGSYEAMIVCAESLCRLDCTPAELFGASLSCPTGMTCEADAFGTSYCYR
jgi:hypothetical protein